MPDFGPAELAIILVVVVLIFGTSRLGELGGSLGKGIKDFRKELKDDSDVTPATTATQLPAAQVVVTTAPAAAPAPAAGVICANCDTENSPTAVFCNECGKPLHPAKAE